jgi:hypothetical protein
LCLYTFVIHPASVLPLIARKYIVVTQIFNTSPMLAAFLVDYTVIKSPSCTASFRFPLFDVVSPC